MVELTRVRRAPRWALIAAVVLTACTDASDDPEAASSSTTKPSSTFATPTATTAPPATSPELVAPIVADLLDRYERAWGAILVDPLPAAVDPAHPSRAELGELFTADSRVLASKLEFLDSGPAVVLRAGEYGTVAVEMRITRVDSSLDADTFIGEVCTYGDYEEIDLASGEVVSDPAETAVSWYGPIEARRIDGQWRLYDFMPSGPETQIAFPAGEGNPCRDETLL